ncbi:MAG TPA: cation:proton antiporter [Candidatus Magasanikbacteria bacterium]|nr:cation:proton antiporter [Candidatus Magasanikbacteria bacterium]
MEGNIFLQISALLGITVSVAFVIRLLRQPLMVAYIIAGIVAGPLFLNLLHGENSLFEAFSSFGVVLLLFVVGLSLDFGFLKQIGKTAVWVGFVQMAITVGLGLIVLRFLDFSWIGSLYLAAALTFSSTIIVTKLLADKQDLDAVYGRYTMGLMLVQDIIAILIMVFLGMNSVGSWQSSIIPLLMRGALLVVLVILLTKYVVSFILDRAAKSGEFLFLFTIAWCFGVASLVYYLGFSLEIGAIIAGLTLGSSAYRAEIASRVKPLRDFFIVLFFIILGSEMVLGDWRSAIVPSVVIIVFILLAEPFILYFLYRAGKFTRRNSFLASVAAGHVSEFGFVLLLTGKSLGHLSGMELPVFTMVALTTIVVSSYVITYNEQIYRVFLPFFNLFGRDKYQQKDQKIDKHDVWVVGYHRIGWKVCDTLRKKHIDFAVIDYNPETVARLRKRGLACYFGDVSDVEFLDSLSLAQAKLVISTLPQTDDQKTMIQHIRRAGSKASIVVNCNHSHDLDDLYDAGADYAMMPHLLGGEWISDEIIGVKWTKSKFKALREEQAEEMRWRHSMKAHK